MLEQTLHLLLYMGLILIGVSFNLLAKLVAREEEGRSVTPWRYVMERPYRSAMLALSTIMAALLLYFVDQLNYSTALMLGVTADLVADKMRAKAGQRIDQALDQVP